MSSKSKVSEIAAKIATEAIVDIRTVTSLHQQNLFLNKYIEILEKDLKYTIISFI